MFSTHTDVYRTKQGPFALFQSSEGFQNWAPHDPDNLGVDGEDCASMLLTAVPDDEGYVPGTWVDVDCSTSIQFYMCERGNCIC